jgi:polar amino acid transport system substrate-binding protein
MRKTAAALSAIAAIAAGCAQTPQAPQTQEAPQAQQAPQTQQAPQAMSKAPPAAASAEAKAQLAPTGVLRVAVLTSNPIIGAKDPGTGELSGTTVALGRALAERAGIPVRMIEYTAVNKLVEDAALTPSGGVWDVTVVAIDPARRNVLDFAPAHLAADGFLTVLVPPGSAARTMADIDRAGMRVAAVRGAAPAMILERTLQYARVVPAENENAAFALMKDGKADGYAQNRFMLRVRAATLPGSRVIDDAFAGLRLSFALPKARPAAVQFVAAFVEEAKASGAVQKAIDAAGVAGDVKVAPIE